MKNKYITLDYTEYLELLDRLQKIEELLSRLYNNSTKEQQNEISSYMRTYCNWI